MAIIIISMVLLGVCFQHSLASDIKSPKDEIADIRKLLQDQNERILKLESENLALKSRLSHVERDNADLKEQVVGVAKTHELLQDEVVNLRRQLSEMRKLPEQNNLRNLNIREPQNMKHRRLLALVTDPPTASVDLVAFYAYMSKPEPNPSNHFTLIFDVVRTNLGNGYNKHSGTFVAPSAGAYVITWTINTSPHGAHHINLMVNSAIAGGTLTDTEETGDYDSDSNTAVLVLNQGDSVNLRITYPSVGILYADSRAFTSFSGWKL
uniref:Uncharacterized protein LOC111120578 isoform X2 n=1 Tax=Crassostrea virginica TaxID=6565 RepID=A0A8B8CMM1_CRAVI|nr:uncharacterized protein LOC111120578 isoform X2 [Crassostrea virginica]